MQNFFRPRESIWQVEPEENFQKKHDIQKPFQVR